MKGFTLFEMILCIALLSMLMACSSLAGISVFRRGLVLHDMQTTLSVLANARAQTLHDVCFSSCTTSLAYGVFTSGNKIQEISSAGTNSEEQVLLQSSLLFTASTTTMFVLDQIKKKLSTISARTDTGQGWDIGIGEHGVLSTKIVP